MTLENMTPIDSLGTTEREPIKSKQLEKPVEDKKDVEQSKSILVSTAAKNVSVPASLVFGLPGKLMGDAAALMTAVPNPFSSLAQDAFQDPVKTALKTAGIPNKDLDRASNATSALLNALPLTSQPSAIAALAQLDLKDPAKLETDFLNTAKTLMEGANLSPEKQAEVFEQMLDKEGLAPEIAKAAANIFAYTADDVKTKEKNEFSNVTQSLSKFRSGSLTDFTQLASDGQKLFEAIKDGIGDKDKAVGMTEALLSGTLKSNETAKIYGLDKISNEKTIQASKEILALATSLKDKNPVDIATEALKISTRLTSELPPEDKKIVNGALAKAALSVIDKDKANAYSGMIADFISNIPSDKQEAVIDLLGQAIKDTGVDTITKNPQSLLTNLFADKPEHKQAQQSLADAALKTMDDIAKRVTTQPPESS